MNPLDDATLASSMNNAGVDLFNFVVYKYNKLQKGQRRILQIDFQARILCNIKRGNRDKRFEFSQIEGCECEDGLRFTISFSNHENIEYDADSIEEKNKISRIVNFIAQQSKNLGDAGNVADENGDGNDDAEGSASRASVFYLNRNSQSYNTQQLFQQSRTIIMEGEVEKRGHSASMMFWSRRWLRITAGEVSYFKIDDLTNALNIIPLDLRAVTFSKVPNGFVIFTSKKQFSFRVIGASEKAPAQAEQERDTWYSALLKASNVAPGSSEMIGSLASQLTGVILTLQKQLTDLKSHLSVKKDESSLRQVDNVVSLADKLNDYVHQASVPKGSVATPFATKPGASALASSANSNNSLGGDPSSRAGNEVGKKFDQSSTQAGSTSGGDAASPAAAAAAVSATIAAPPPPPPPMMIGGGGGGPPPPPPMGMLPPGLNLPPKKTLQPSVKMKPLHWNKLPPMKVVDSVWCEMREDSIKFDATVLEERFGLESKGSGSSKTRKKEKVEVKSLLDAKRAQNIGIFLSGYKLTLSELGQLINNVGEDGLPIEQIIALKRFIPTPEEVEAFKNYKENKAELAPADQFLMQLMDIPNLSARLDLLFTLREFPDRIGDLEPELDATISACKDLMQNQQFVKVLEYILAIGNYVNGSTSRGGAYGIKLSSLVKVNELFGTERKYTLVDFLVETLMKQQPDLCLFTDSLVSIQNAAQCSVKGINAEAELLIRDLEKIRKTASDLESNPKSSSSDKQFAKDLHKFLDDHNRKLETLKAKSTEMSQAYKTVLAKFAEAPTTDSEELFGCLSFFISRFAKAYEALLSPDAPELQKRREREALEKEKERERYAQLQNQEQGSSVAVSYTSSTSSEPLKAVKRQDSKNSPQPPAHVTPAKLKKPLVGFLDKLSGGKHVKPKWDTRWFELIDGYLHYYKKREGKPVGSIHLKGCPISMDSHDSKCIVIVTPERQWQLRAKTESEAKDWYDAFYGAS